MTQEEIEIVTNGEIVVEREMKIAKERKGVIIVRKYGHRYFPSIVDSFGQMRCLYKKRHDNLDEAIESAEDALMGYEMGDDEDEGKVYSF